jgi:radical SAM superfamily enzyme YgiQ (UPF0313 family)
LSKSQYRILFSDLTHTGVGLNADVFPLGLGFVAAYACQELTERIEVELFKFPDDLNKALKNAPPDVLCFSSYAWNARLTYKFAEYTKKTYPGAVTIFGGPDFPLPEDERKDFLLERPAIDFFIKWDGEHALVGLLKNLFARDMDFKGLKAEAVSLPNVCYVDQSGQYVEGPDHRVRDLMTVPSPYLVGLMDQFFEYPMMPSIETTRGCPYACTFCNDGSTLRSKIYQKTPEYVRNELLYIASKKKKSNQLAIADLNFGMYQEDIETARTIRDIRKSSGWPDRIQTSIGKSNPGRILEVVKTINEGNTGIIKLSSSLQSTDDEVTKNIKRKNLSMTQLMDMRRGKNEIQNNNLQDYTELIVPLPGETVEKHRKSLRDVVDTLGMNNIDVHQLTMLRGSEMATKPHRKLMGLEVKYRMFVGCLGIYDIGDERVPCAEVEETVIANKTISFDEYLDCRVLDFLVKVFIDNNPFREMFGIVRKMGLSSLDVLLEMRQSHVSRYPALASLLDEFVARTKRPMYNSLKELDAVISKADYIQDLISGNYDQNEMLTCRVMAFSDHFHDLALILRDSVLSYLKKKQVLTADMEAYVIDAARFCENRKFDFRSFSKPKEEEFEFDFVEAEKVGFEIEPSEFKRKSKIRLYYDDEDLSFINRQVSHWGTNTLHHLGKFLQKSNSLKIRRKILRAF